jgi:pimeloyl-ACP methyl ester carboxylesterase
MNHLRVAGSLTFGVILAVIQIAAQSANAATDAIQPIKNVVLVHGAWADGSSWDKIIPLLEKMGLHVTAVHLPFTTLADDVAAVRHTLALEDGPVLLVGHSYGGAVITEAGNCNEPREIEIQ